MNINEICEKIIFLLRESSYTDEANEIRFLVEKMISNNIGVEQRRACKEKLMARCHPKWLGDLYIRNLSYQEWMNTISSFFAKVKKYNIK